MRFGNGFDLRRCDLSMEGLSDSGYGNVPIGPERMHWTSFLGPWGSRGGLRTLQASSVDQSALWPVSLWRLKFIRPHVFLNSKTMTGGLWRPVFSNKYLLGENLVLNVRESEANIFPAWLGGIVWLTDHREHSVLGPLKRFHPHRFVFCLFHLHLHHLCLLQTIIMRLDAPHHLLQIRILVVRLSLNLFYPLLTSATLCPHWDDLPPPWHSLTIPTVLLAWTPPDQALVPSSAPYQLPCKNVTSLSHFLPYHICPEIPNLVKPICPLTLSHIHENLDTTGGKIISDHICWILFTLMATNINFHPFSSLQVIFQRASL